MRQATARCLETGLDFIPSVRIYLPKTEKEIAAGSLNPFHRGHRASGGRAGQ